MKHSLKKWLALLCTAALLLSVLTVTTLFTLAEEEWDVVRKASEYDGVSTYHQADSGIPQYDGVSGWRFSAGAPYTGTVYFDAGTTVAAFKVTAILGHAGATSMLGFAVSADNSSWTTVTPAAAAESGGWPGCTYTCTPDAAFRYLRVDFLDTAYSFDPLLCNVYFKEQADDAAYGIVKKANEYLRVSTFQAADSSIPPYDGVLGWRFSTGAKCLGTVVYNAGMSVTDFKVTAILGHNGATDMLAFEVSADKSTWTAVTPAAAAESGGWPGCTYTCTPDAAFQYLRITFRDSAYAYDPLLCNIYFKNDTGEAAPVVYDVKKGPAEYSSISDASQYSQSDLPAQEGVAPWRFSAGAATTGWVVFDAGKAVDAFKAVTVLGSNLATSIDDFSFDVSSDGSNWTAVTAANSDVPAGSWPACEYTYVSDSSFRYLRVNFVGSTYGWDPGLANVYFRTVAGESEPESSVPESSVPESSVPESSVPESSVPESSEPESSEPESSEPTPEVPAKPTDFNNKKFAAEAAVAEGQTVHAEDEVGGYYTLRNADGSAMINGGSLVFTSKTAIESYNFATMASTIGWNGTWSFAASKDGETWVELTPTTVKTADAANANWGAAFYDNYGTLDKADGYKYLRATVSCPDAMLALPFPSLAYVEYYAEGLPDGVVEEAPDLADLDLPYEETLFSENYKNGLFKTDNMVLSINNANVDYFGAQYALIVMENSPSSVIMYTPNVRDFKFVLSSTVTGDNLVVRAFGRTEQYGEETEIPLIRTGNIRPEEKGKGTPWYQFRVADRDNMAQDYEYIRVQITGAQWTNMLNFTYFYDGPEPGDVPDDERAEPEDTIGTERENVQTINANKGNLGAVATENMGVADNGGNATYIGAKAGIVIYPDASKDAWSVFATEGIDMFWVKFLVGTEEQAQNLVAKFYVAPSAEAEEDEWTEIAAHLEACTDTKQPTGWKAIEYVMDEDQVIPAGSNCLKVFIPAAENNNIGTSCQIARVDYTYSLPEVTPLPEMAQPDTANGEKELLEDLAGQHLTTEDGGLAEEEYGLEWTILNLGTDNGTDKVLYKTDYDSYLIYKVDNVTAIDIRGYRHEDCTDDLVVYVSKDGREWIALEQFTRLDSKLYGGPVQYAHRIDTAAIPAGMNYVRIEIPEMEVLSDITISDIQILYNVNRLPADASEESTNSQPGTDVPNTGVALPTAALLLAGIAGAVLTIGRKRRMIG